MEISEEIVMVPGDDFETLQLREKFVWNQHMVKLLISEYKKVQHEFNHSTIKKKHIWRKIAQSFVSKGYHHITEDMCDKKWRNLKKTFKEIYVGVRGMNSKTKWPYYNDVEEIFGKDPNIMNAASLSVSNKNFLKCKQDKSPEEQDVRVELMEVIGNLDDEYGEDGETAVEGDENQLWTTYETTPSQEPPVWFSEFLQQYRADEERRTELLSKMHADIMAVEEKKCTLLSALLEKLGGSHTDPVEESPDYYLQLGKEPDGETGSDN